MLLYLDHRAYVCEDKECFRNSNTYSLKQKPRIVYRTKRGSLLSSDSHTAAEIVVLQKMKGTNTKSRAVFAIPPHVPSITTPSPTP